MDKRPLWPIPVGVALWGGVAYAVYNDIWWPLWVAIPLSVIPGLGALAVFIATKRVKESSSQLIPEKQAREPERGVVEPPRASKGGPRTNAKTAGRRRRGEAGAIALLVATALAGDGCKKIEDKLEHRSDDAKKTAAKTDTKAVPDSAAAPAPAPPKETPEQLALAAVLARSIEPPKGSDATYRVDPFLAALVYEEIKAGTGPRFQPDEAPRVGFKVGAVAGDTLLHRLGLRTGDVIEAINGVQLTDASRVAFALDGAENSVALTIVRDDVTITQCYRLTHALAWTELLASLGGGTAIAAGEGGTPEPSSDEGIPPADDGRGEGALDGGSIPDDHGKPIKPSGGGGGGTSTPKPIGGGGGGGGTTPTKPSGASQVSCEGSRCTISKAYFDKMTSSPTAINSQASIVPAIQNDVFSGYKLKSVKAGSNVAKLGFQSGDKITHINGKDLTNDIEAAQVYFGLGSTKVYKVRFIRGGAQMVKTIVVE
jgi:hypothetical protein